jgi:hypothetical protein
MCFWRHADGLAVSGIGVRLGSGSQSILRAAKAVPASKNVSHCKYCHNMTITGDNTLEDGLNCLMQRSLRSEHNHES